MKTGTSWIQLSKAAFDHNVSLYKKVIGNRYLALVIKANAYGHGLSQIGLLAQENPLINWLCVAFAYEALTLRHQGVTKPILITTHVDTEPELLLNQEIDITVYSIAYAKQLNAIARSHNASFYIHVKVDTGLSRLGFTLEELPSVLKALQEMEHLIMRGIYSHCADSSSGDQTFTLLQAHRFEQAIEITQKLTIPITVTHFANSAATTTLDLPFCNLFRIGVGAYGMWPSQTIKRLTQERHAPFILTPMLQWYTTIIALKSVKAGTPIGYDCTYTAAHNMKVAILPIGYADGYDFRLFNKGCVIINHQCAPLVGRISMNMCTVDVTHINCDTGTLALLMGPYSSIHPSYLGELAGNPNTREITTKISSTIERSIDYSTQWQPTKNDLLLVPNHQAF